MPEIGLDDEPISPVSREETVTNKNPKSTISTAATQVDPVEHRGQRPAAAGLRIKPQEDPDGRDQQQRAQQNDPHR